MSIKTVTIGATVALLTLTIAACGDSSHSTHNADGTDNVKIMVGGMNKHIGTRIPPGLAGLMSGSGPDTHGHAAGAGHARVLHRLQRYPHFSIARRCSGTYVAYGFCCGSSQFT